MSNASTLNQDRILWKAYPSWRHFTWLYLFSSLSAFRAGLYLFFEIPTWEIWIVGAIFLLSCVFVIRHWAHYFITSAKVEIKNGYTGHEIDAIKLTEIKEVTITQGLVASFLNTGTLTIHALDPNQKIRFRGIKDPEVVKVRLEALLPAIPETKELGETSP